MNILLLSDTHGYLDKNILSYAEKCDEIWHAGDIGDKDIISSLENIKPLRAVYGNIDGSDIRMICAEHQNFFCAGLRIWMTHIGGRPPKYYPHIVAKIQKEPIDIFVCGHSHILQIMHDHKHDKMLYLNPGAAGKYGIHQVRTMLTFTLNKKEVKNVKVVTLGKK